MWSKAASVFEKLVESPVFPPLDRIFYHNGGTTNRFNIVYFIPYSGRIQVFVPRHALVALDYVKRVLRQLPPAR
jgi:hypothetical protein